MSTVECEEIDVTQLLDALERLMTPGSPYASPLDPEPDLALPYTEVYNFASGSDTRWCARGCDELDHYIWELLSIKDRISLAELVSDLEGTDA